MSDDLLGLAPVNLISYRTRRYDGAGFEVSLADFAAEDRERVQALYRPLRQLYELWLYMRDAPRPEVLEAAVIALDQPGFLANAKAIGEATRRAGEVPRAVRQALHDIRGGALAVLVTQVRLVADGLAGAGEVQAAVWMARDHAKMMRNAVADLDPVIRAADEGLKIHPVDDFIRKWHGTSAEFAGHRVTVQVRATFTGTIANRCLETSALDRVLFNHLNNALRFAADKTVQLDILAIGDRLVRWVVRNRLRPDQLAWLAEQVGDDLGALYRGGLTREGSGIGLNTCAEIQAACFGLADGEEAVADGYLGARLLGDTYASWFHWPAADGQD